uniref:Ig-like domain-containing protein n=1 Tax=Acrobeloides nanus TaxID=290746 RepID=A0A914EPV1_9BILA
MCDLNKFFIFSSALIVFYGSCWEIRLSPDPNVFSVGQRPAGTPLAIMCIITGVANGQSPGLIWTKSGNGISTTGNVEVKRLDPFTLLIRNSSLEDSGIYVCTASYNEETKTVSVDVNFFEELHFISENGDIENPKESSNFNLSCEVHLTSRNPNELITMWEKGIVALTRHSERSYMFFANNQILQINNYNSSLDDGTYQCKVFDKKTGSIIFKEIKVGNLAKKGKQQFCSNLCSTLCTKLYSKDNNGNGNGTPIISPKRLG